MPSTLPFAPRSNESLDSSITGTIGTRQTATSRGTYSTAATSLEVEDGDYAAAGGDGDEAEEEEEMIFYDVANIMAWL